MPFNIGPGELILILVIALVVLGPGKLPDVASSLGKSIREFRKAATDVTEAGKLDAPPSTPAVTSATATPASPPPATAVAAPPLPVDAPTAPVDAPPATPAPNGATSGEPAGTTAAAGRDSDAS
jgi:TatA/E family protein of Tat protein translocase